MEQKTDGTPIKNRRPLSELVGQKIGRLFVLGALRYEGRSGRLVVLCRCDCGTVKEILAQSLRSGATKSCGCLNKDAAFRKTLSGRRTHGMTATATYRVWRNMHSRCENPNVNGYEHYGGRGISVCDRWFKFESFLQDMGEKPSAKTLDRIDVNGPYSPENCRWATNAEQAANRRDNHRITFGGETLILSDWAARIGLSVGTLSARLRAGVPLHIALTTPTLPKNYDKPLRFKSRSEIRAKRKSI